MGPFTHNAVRNGYWSDPFTWDTVTVPGDEAEFIPLPEPVAPPVTYP